MKNINVFFIFYVLLGFIPNSALSQWLNISGQTPGETIAVAVSPLGDMFISTSTKDMYRSEDGGINWVKLPYPESPVKGIHFIGDQEMFTSGDWGVIYYSSDNGNSWVARSNGISPADIITTIVKSPTGKLFLGGYTDCLSCDGGGIYQSTDNGNSWSLLAFLNNYFNCIAIDSEGVIYANAYNGVYKSTDDGDSWQLKNTGMGGYDYIKYISIAGGDTIWAATEVYGNKMYRSINKGESWELKSVGLPNDEVSGLLNYAPYVFCCYKNAGIYRTDDQGNSWGEVTWTIPNFQYYSLAKSSYNSLLTATSGGVFKSDYQGLEWNKLTNSIAHLLISSITIAANGNIIAGSDGGGIYTSSNQGLSWNQNSILNTDNDYEFNHIQKNSNNEIFAAVHGYIIYNSLYKSTDQGISWGHIGVGHSTEYGITSLYIDENDKLYTGEFDRINFSTDNGATWTSTHIWGSSSWVYSIVSKPDDLVIIGTYGSGIFRSTDGGLSFVAAGLAYQHVYALLRDSLGNIYAGSTGGFFRSTDDGITWQPHNNGLDGGSTILDLLLLGDKTILATSYSGFYFTEDQGDNWYKLNDGLLSAYARSLALNINNTIYLGTNEGVYKFFGELPVEILSFSPSVIDNDVTLHWTTATEINNSGFEIERSLTPTPSLREGAFETIAFIPGHGTTSEKQSYSFKDENLSSRKYLYRLKQIDFDGSFEYSKTIEVEVIAPLDFSLEQNYPNPFNPTTIIRYTIQASPKSSPKERTFVSLIVYDVLGNEVITLVNENKPAGSYEVEFNPALSIKNPASGVYFYQLKAGEFVQTRKMILIK